MKPYIMNYSKNTSNSKQAEKLIMSTFQTNVNEDSDDSFLSKSLSTLMTEVIEDDDNDMIHCNTTITKTIEDADDELITY